MDLGSIEYFLSREETVVRANEYMSRVRPSQHRTACWKPDSRTFSIIAEAHLRLAKTNGILALADAIELLEFCLVDTLSALVSHRRTTLLLLRALSPTWLGK